MLELLHFMFWKSYKGFKNVNSLTQCHILYYVKITFLRKYPLIKAYQTFTTMFLNSWWRYNALWTCWIDITNKHLQALHLLISFVKLPQNIFIQCVHKNDISVHHLVKMSALIMLCGNSTYSLKLWIRPFICLCNEEDESKNVNDHH